MSSDRKITANRINGRKSRGPTSVRGKARSSRNALRHGLSTISHFNPTYSEEIKRTAKALCNGSSDPRLFEQALQLAESNLVRRHVCLERTATIERLRTPTALAYARERKAVAFAKAWFKEARLVYDEWEELDAKVEAKIEKFGLGDDDKLGQGMSWELVPELHWRRLIIQSRDEFAAIEEAMPDLKRLDRYERRAWSRWKRAVRKFIEVKLAIQRRHHSPAEVLAGSRRTEIGSGVDLAERTHRP